MTEEHLLTVVKAAKPVACSFSGQLISNSDALHSTFQMDMRLWRSSLCASIEIISNGYHALHENKLTARCNLNEIPRKNLY